jgi:hypothetical protein
MVTVLDLEVGKESLKTVSLHVVLVHLVGELFHPVNFGLPFNELSFDLFLVVLLLLICLLLFGFHLGSEAVKLAHKVELGR